jgi:membrane protein YdbS with pleckstrin-like domain
VLLAHGVWWQTRRSIPRSRIQHVDIESGPIERALGLSNLILFTAGTGDSDGRIPGLRQATAEALREVLLQNAPASADGTVAQDAPTSEDPTPPTLAGGDETR